MKNATSPAILSIRELADKRIALSERWHRLTFREDEYGEVHTEEIETIDSQRDEIDYLIDHMAAGMTYSAAVDCYLVDHEPVLLTRAA